MGRGRRGGAQGACFADCRERRGQVRWPGESLDQRLSCLHHCSHSWDMLALEQTLDPKKVTNLVLAMSSTTTLANLHTLLPAASPQYTFFSFSPSSAGADTAPLVIFIYT